MGIENDAASGSAQSHANNTKNAKNLRDILIATRAANGRRTNDSGNSGNSGGGRGKKDNGASGNGWSKDDYANYGDFLERHYGLENAKHDAHAARTIDLIDRSGGSENLKSVKFHHGTGNHEIQFGAQAQGNGKGSQGSSRQFLNPNEALNNRNYFAGETAGQAASGMGMVDRTNAGKVDSRLSRFEEKHLADKRAALLNTQSNAGAPTPYSTSGNQFPASPVIKPVRKGSKKKTVSRQFDPSEPFGQRIMENVDQQMAESTARINAKVKEGNRKDLEDLYKDKAPTPYTNSGSQF
jgi:hypothetical protein